MIRKTNEPVTVTPGGGKERLPESGETMEPEVQESAAHSFREDDALKRIIRRHPQKGIPQVEGIEPQEAPPKESGRAEARSGPNSSQVGCGRLVKYEAHPPTLPRAPPSLSPAKKDAVPEGRDLPQYQSIPPYAAARPARW